MIWKNVRALYFVVKKDKFSFKDIDAAAQTSNV